MIISDYSTMNDSLLRKIDCQVDLFEGNTIKYTFLPSDKLQEVTIARTGEKGKFFGFGICQQATVKIIDPQGTLDIKKDSTIKIYFNVNSRVNQERVCPTFYVKEVIRDEKTNIITITAYDALDVATARLISELDLQVPYMLSDVIRAICDYLGLYNISCSDGFDVTYEEGANIGGEETLRDILNAIAEVTQTIYYVDNTDVLVFKRLDKSGESVLTINKKDYFELTKGLPVTLTKIVSVTDLGESVEAGDTEGTVQYVRDNPFWTNRTDLETLLQESINRISGLTVVPYSLNWRGNFLTEIGDKINIEAKDGSFVTTYILDDSFTYTGGFSQTSDWEYDPEGDKETADNPVKIGEKLNQTFAKVDKINKEIILVASEVDENSEKIASIELNTESINNAVEEIQTNIETSLDGINQELVTITERVETSMTKDEFVIEVEKIVANGTSKVETTTGFTFDEDGLTISKTDSEMSTQITEDGMSVSKDGEVVLTANNEGVYAQNLHATTFLIIGDSSRFETFTENGETRVGCFWIGG